MENNLIEKYKKDYEERIAERERIREIIKELVQLKKHEYVKRYIQLEEYDNDSNKKIISMSDEDILDELYLNCQSQVNETNNIYVCIGKGYPGYEENDRYVISYPVSDDIKLSLAFYRNIETYKDGYIIPVEQCLDFENTHIVLEGNYTELSKKFFNSTILDGQEKAVEKILLYKLKNKEEQPGPNKKLTK